MTGDFFIDWLLLSAAACFALLSVGAGITWCCREPIDRIEVIRWTFAACFLVPLLQPLPWVPRLSLALLPAPEARAKRAEPDVTPVKHIEPIKATSSAALGKSGSVEDAPEKDVRAAGDEVNLGGPRSAPAWSLRAWMASLSPRQMLFLLVKAAYGLLLLGIAAAFLRGRFVMARLAATARPADGELLAILESIASRRLGAGRRVRLLVSDEITAPLMWGLWRPTILLPSGLCKESGRQLTRYSLAHEWSHVMRRDYLALSAANLAKVTCFFQPLYWALRRELLLCQDFLADAFAARQGGSAEDYSEFLLSLAKTRQPSLPLQALGIRESGKSKLRKRISALVQSSFPFVEEQNWRRAMKFQGAILGLVVLLCAVRVSTRASEPAQADSLTYEGRVIDRVSGAPIDGATVKITRRTRGNRQSPHLKIIETTEHKTDAAGKYQFTVPPDQVKDPLLYLEAEAEHPNYQPMSRGGYGHGMIRKNLALGDPPFFAEIKLSRGEAVTVTVKLPNGDPATNMEVSAYTRAGQESRDLDYSLGAFHKTKTDERGQATVVVPTPGDGVIWVKPKDHAPVAKRIGGWRGNLEPIMLSEGRRLKGRVLDAQGEPVANVGVSMRRTGDGPEVDSFLHLAGVGNGISRAAMTDAAGNFELRPLIPLGEFEVKVSSFAIDSSEGGWESNPETGKSSEALPDVFVPLKLKFEGRPPDSIEVRAVPHITIRGRVFDSKGNPRTAHEQFFHGSVGKGWFFARSNIPGDDGWFEIRAPKGMRDVDWHLQIHSHGAMRWRRSHDEPLTYGDIKIKELNEDWETLEMIRYEAPLLLVKVVDEQGAILDSAMPEAKYKSRPDSEKSPATYFVGGIRGDVGFEKQADGRWRSSCLLPEEETTVTATKEGYLGEPKVVSLKEGATEEVVIQMKKN